MPIATPPPTLIENLKAWQQGIASLIGFAALMIAALWNYHLGRRRDTRLRQEEAASLASALYSEILLLRGEVARLANGVARRYAQYGTGVVRGKAAFDQHFRESFQLPEPVLYTALASKIGLLPPEVTRGIVNFHASYAAAKWSFPLLEDREERDFSYGIIWVLRPAVDAVRNVEPALQAVEAMLGIAVGEPLDVKVASDALAWEEELQQMTHAPD